AWRAVSEVDDALWDLIGQTEQVRRVRAGGLQPQAMLAGQRVGDLVRSRVQLAEHGIDRRHLVEAARRLLQGSGLQVASECRRDCRARAQALQVPRFEDRARLHLADAPKDE